MIRKSGLLVVHTSLVCTSFGSFGGTVYIVTSRANISRPNVRLVTRQEKSRSHQTKNCTEEGQTFVQLTPGYFVLNEILLAVRFHHLKCMLVLGASLSNLNDIFYTVCGFIFVRPLHQVSPEVGIINTHIHTYWEHCRSRQMCDAQ